MQAEIVQLKKQVKQFQIGLIACIVLLLFILFSAFHRPVQEFDVLRAKGIIIEDSMGRDRILIGAPIPYSKSRVRTDTNLVRKYWAKDMGGNQYMKWYKDYQHSANGMVVLNEQGFDKVLMGEKLADPNIGKRMFQASGVMWNDDEGYERGGLGVNKTKDGKYRSVIGVDNYDGEAVHMVALEDGTNALALSGNDCHLVIGMSKDGDYFNNKGAFTGIRCFDNKGNLLWEQKVK